jgi:hypothetical protein
MAVYLPINAKKKVMRSGQDSLEAYKPRNISAAAIMAVASNEAFDGHPYQIVRDAIL